MKAGGTRPTAPKKFLFSKNTFVHSKRTSLLAVVVVVVVAEFATHDARLKQRQQSTSGARHKHVRTSRQLSKSEAIPVTGRGGP
jgi:hypothetical protein